VRGEVSVPTRNAHVNVLVVVAVDGDGDLDVGAPSWALLSW
jgi:hypothetical protein